MINMQELKQRIQKYPLISKRVERQLRKLSQSNQSLRIEPVHSIISWIDCFCDNPCKQLLNQMEGVLTRLQSSHFLTKQKLLNKLGTEKDEFHFRSVNSELFLANFFIKNGIDLLEYEPMGKNSEKRADFKISLGITDVIVELVTPNTPSNDFEEKQNHLIEKLRRIESGFLIEVIGFELYDSSNLQSTRVEPPLDKHIDEIIANFRETVKNISDSELPKELPQLCSDYQRIKIRILRRNPNHKYTCFTSDAVRTGEVFPINRVMDKILGESKHLSSDDFNFVFVDLTNWIFVELHDLDSPIHREMLINEMKKNMSLKVDGVFSYIVSNLHDETLIKRRILYLNSIKPLVIQSDMQTFLRIWESGD